MKHFSAVCLLAVFLICTPIEGRANLINGDFSGDLITFNEFVDGSLGWVADQNYSDSTSLVGVINEQAVLRTGGIVSGPFVISLWQWLEIPDWAATISFDVSFANTSPDEILHGSDEETFPDFFQASYWDDDDSGDYDVFFVAGDANGFYDVDVAPVYPEALGSNWFRFSTSISQLAGRSGTLYFDLFDEDDGFFSTAMVDNVVIGEAASTPIPEPAGLLLLGSGLFGLLCIMRRRNSIR